MSFSPQGSLPITYFQQKDVVALAKDLLGKELVCEGPEGTMSGIIVETEAYGGVTDRASHAFGNRRTKRTETMYLPGGHLYVYLCYGIHQMLNIVTNEKDIPQAILIRALEPRQGQELMRRNRGLHIPENQLCSGPGSLTRALGIDASWDKLPLDQPRVRINEGLTPDNVIASARVGVAYAREDALLPWRFRIAGNPCTSKAK